MVTNVANAPSRNVRVLGTLCVVAGTVAIVSDVFIGVTSFTAFNPPSWARAVGILLFPVGFIGTGVLGWQSWRAGNRTMAIVGLSLAAAALLGLVAMFVYGG